MQSSSVLDAVAWHAHVCVHMHAQSFACLCLSLALHCCSAALFMALTQMAGFKDIHVFSSQICSVCCHVMAQVLPSFVWQQTGSACASRAQCRPCMLVSHNEVCAGQGLLSLVPEDAGEQLCRQSLEQDSDAGWASAWLGSHLCCKGQYEDAIPHLQVCCPLFGAGHHSPANVLLCQDLHVRSSWCIHCWCQCLVGANEGCSLSAARPVSCTTLGAYEGCGLSHKYGRLSAWAASGAAGIQAAIRKKHPDAGYMPLLSLDPSDLRPLYILHPNLTPVGRLRCGCTGGTWGRGWRWETATWALSG